MHGLTPNAKTLPSSSVPLPPLHLLSCSPLHSIPPVLLYPQRHAVYCGCKTSKVDNSLTYPCVRYSSCRQRAGKDNAKKTEVLADRQGGAVSQSDRQTRSWKKNQAIKLLKTKPKKRNSTRVDGWADVTEADAQTRRHDQRERDRQNKTGIRAQSDKEVGKYRQADNNCIVRLWCGFLSESCKQVSDWSPVFFFFLMCSIPYLCVSPTDTHTLERHTLGIAHNMPSEAKTWVSTH